MALTLAVAFTSINFPVYAADLENETQVQEIENEPSETEEVSEDEADTETEETVPEENAGEQETTPDAEQNVGEEAQTEQPQEEPEEELEEEQEEEQDLVGLQSTDEFEINGTTLTKYNGTGGAVVIPNGITTIGYGAFSGATSVTSVEIPNSVTKIETSAFGNCTGLKSITIPSSVKEIGYRAFALGDGSTETSVVIESKTLTCGTSTFEGRTITSAKLPEGMSSLPALFNHATFTAGYELKLPSTVTKIEQNAFSNTKGLKEVVFNAKLLTIDDYAFSGSSVEVVKFPESLQKIGCQAFCNCNGITEITIPSKVNEIEYQAFMLGSGSAETKVVVKSKALSCGSSTFEGRTITSAELPEGMSSVPQLFNHATFTTGYEFKLPSTVTKIEQYAFSNTKGLSKVVFDDKLQTIDDYAFSGSSVEVVKFPESLQKIGCQTFCNCNGITEITIPSKVNEIEYQAFMLGSGSAETKVVVKSKALSCGSSIFEGRTITSAELPEGMSSVPQLFNHATFTTDYEFKLPSTVTKIEQYAFSNTKGLSKVVFDDKLQTIDDYAFSGSSIEEIKFPESLQTIGFQAFCNCNGITEVTIPSKVSEIETYAFELTNGSTGTTVTIKSKSLTCGSSIFEGRTITSVELPEGMKTMPCLFDNATFDPEVVVKLPSSVTEIGRSAFNRANGLSKVVLGDKVVTIADYAFSNSSIEEIELPETVQTIGFQAFCNCKSLSKVIMGSNIKEIGWDAFNGCDNAYFYVKKGSTTEKTLLKYYKNNSDRITTMNGISYKLNNGEMSGSYPSIYSKDDGSIELTDPTREDYKFVGWYYDAKFTKPAGKHVGDITTIDVSSMNSNITLHAKWDGPYYTVTFDAGTYGELSGESTLEVKNGNTYGTLPTVTVKNEYANQKELLEGWYTEEGELITAETKVTAEAKNQTLYAKYQSVKNSIAAPTVGIWGADEAEDLGTLEATVGDKVYIRCAEDGASLTYSLAYSNENKAEQASYTDEATDAEYTGTFKLAKTGFYKVTAVATFKDKTQTTEVVIHVTEEKADSDLYDTKNANAFWVTYGDEIYDASAIEVPFTGADVALSGYEVYYGKKLLKEGTDYKVTYKNNKAVAAYDAAKAPTIIFTAKGNYTGTIEKSFSIVKGENAVTLAAKNVTVTLEDKTWTFDGQAKEPAVEKVVYKDPKTKKETEISDTDYTVTYANNTNASKKAQVIVTFKGINFCGVVTKTFTINQLDINDASVKIKVDEDVISAQYNANNKTISAIKAIQVKSGDETIYTLKASDYKASVKRTTNSDGTRTEEYTLKGVGNFKGTKKESYDLKKQDFSNVRVLPCVAKQKANFMDETTNAVVAPVWTNKAKNYLPTAYTVVDKYGDVMAINKDYTVSYAVKQPGETQYAPADNKTKYAKDSEVKMTITPKSGSIYTGEPIEATYKLEGSYDLTTLDNLSVTVNDVVYADKANNFNSKIVVVDTRTNTTLKQKTHYTVSYKYTEETKVAGKKNKKSFTNVRDAGEEVKSTDIVPAGTVLTAVITGVGNYDSGEATIEKNFTVGYDINTTKVTVANVTFGENGVAVKPAESDIKVTLKNETVKSSNYDITNFANNTKVGTASFTLVGKGKYVGTKKVTYKIAAKSAKYNVTYDKGLGSLPKNNKSMASTQTAVNGALSANGYVAPAGYEFAGWAYTPQSKLPETADECASMRASLNLPAAKTNTKVIFAVDTENYPVGTDVTLYAWYQLKTK
ncbi:leucine-rich repeat protein [Pseudobutyrivibrio ruminis]|nr:leucine-rich repeat protein [Pseudobutyrivibrio ruminis]